jgi:hypothetical protein
MLNKVPGEKNTKNDKLYPLKHPFVFLVIIMFLGFFAFNISKVIEEVNYRTCIKNCKKIQFALDKYAANNKGTYPSKLSDLVPQYLNEIPICKSAKSDTYSISYKSSNAPLSYTFFCAGNYHKSAGAKLNQPMITSKGSLK